MNPSEASQPVNRQKRDPLIHEIEAFRQELLLGSFDFERSEHGTRVHSVMRMERFPEHILSSPLGYRYFCLWMEKCLDCQGFSFVSHSQYSFRVSAEFPVSESLLREERQIEIDEVLALFPTFQAGVVEFGLVDLWEENYCPAHRPFAIFVTGIHGSLSAIRVVDGNLELAPIDPAELCETHRTRGAKRAFYRSYREWRALFENPIETNLPQMFRWWSMPFDPIRDH